MVLVI